MTQGGPATLVRSYRNVLQELASMGFKGAVPDVLLPASKPELLAALLSLPQPQQDAFTGIDVIVN
jgi:hypothetical protein